ncbi:MAG: hypothetical protein PHX64_02860 [Candidatus Omnitrophica bacterium]|nr:hypothetical protein [Candidatus Omnitrophota bacterium]MDD5310671.1 hypothetical protein [Candidatus Omnitrophota bacterium]MDD5545675.1 hypothetical protein [Candidatus Omnitrophota bacterium]
MKSVIMAVLTVIGCLLSGSLLAGEVSAVASVDLNQIQNEVGYQRLVFMNANDEVKAEMLKLRKTLDQALIECVRENDDSKLAILQTKIQSINNKLNAIRNAMSYRSSDHRRALTRFIKNRYSGKYALVIDAQMGRNNSQVIIWDAPRMTDLTDEIIQELDRELP